MTGARAPVIIINLTGHFGVTTAVARAGVHGGFRVREPAAIDEAVVAAEVSAEELLTTVIPITRKGYSPDLIDGLLERAAATIERLRGLDDPVLEQQRLERADLMQRTLMLAQARADETITEAQTIAVEIRRDAEARAQLLVADAEQIAGHLVETERTRAESILQEALASRDVLERDVAALEQFASQARARLRDALETELGALDRVLSSVNGRPELHEVDLTDPTVGGWEVPNGAETNDTAPHPMTWSADPPGGGHDRPVVALMVRDDRRGR